jgi:hypothetical protein
MGFIDGAHTLIDVETFAWCPMRQCENWGTDGEMCTLLGRIGQSRASRNRVEG